MRLGLLALVTGVTCAGVSDAVAIPVHDACLFGDLAQSQASEGGDHGAHWSGVAQAAASGPVRIVYRLGSLIRGHSQRIEFGVFNAASDPVEVRFVVVVTSDIGRWQRYHLDAGRIGGPGEISGVARLSKAPFPPGECVAKVDVTTIQAKPTI